jgi:hypothetical protein
VKIAQPTWVPDGTGAFTETSTRVAGGVVSSELAVIEPYALLLPICPGMIAAVDAPCVCLNVADQREGLLSGDDDEGVEVDAEPDAHPATATITANMTAPDPRIECSIYAKGGAELELRSAFQFV